MSNLTRTLTPGQRDELIVLLDECAALGATPDQLAPLLAVIYVEPEAVESAPAHPAYD